MKIKSFLLIVLFSVLLTACGNQIKLQQAEEMALKYVQKENTDSWYVSRAESKNGNWIIHTKILGNDCIEKFIYINKKSGTISERGGNAC